MNILITTTTFPTWKNDNERFFVYDFAKNLSETQEEIKVIILAPHTKGAKKREIRGKLTIHRFVYFIEKWQSLCYKNGILANLKDNKLNYLLIPFLLIAEVLAIRKIHRSENINIVHANWLIPQGLAAVIYKKIFNKKIKIICTVHGSDINNLNGFFMEKIKRFTQKNIDHFIAVSNDLKNKINNPKKTTVIPPGLDLKKFKPSLPSLQLKKELGITDECLLFVGRLVKSKGVEYLIKALPKVNKTFPNAKLLIIGDGPEKDDLKKLADKLKLNKNIIFLGNKKNNQLPAFYNLADVLVGPSINEGFGIVFLEALACGTPVIASDIGGIKDIIKEGQAGVMVKPKDCEALADEIIKLLSNKEKIKKINQTAPEFVKNFNWQNNIKKHLQIYYKITAKNENIKQQ